VNTEIVESKNNVPQVVQDKSPMAMMAVAMASGADIGQLEKMMELQFRWEANEAKKAYIKAMSEFKADPPKINKDRKVNFNKTNYSHASLGNVTEKINSGLGAHGLSAAWNTDQAGSAIKVTCTITHKLGHSESTSLSAPADVSGAKNGIQAIGSTISYLERYTILALTGLATHDQDNDGMTAATTAMINESQMSMVVDMMAAASVDHADYLKYLSCESVEQIPANKFNAIIAELKQIAGARK